MSYEVRRTANDYKVKFSTRKISYILINRAVAGRSPQEKTEKYRQTKVHRCSSQKDIASFYITHNIATSATISSEQRDYNQGRQPRRSGVSFDGRANGFSLDSNQSHRQLMTSTSTEVGTGSSLDFPTPRHEYILMLLPHLCLVRVHHPSRNPHEFSARELYYDVNEHTHVLQFLRASTFSTYANNLLGHLYWCFVKLFASLRHCWQDRAGMPSVVDSVCLANISSSDYIRMVEG